MSTLGPFEFGRVYLSDMRDALPKIPSGSVDMVLTDPPYGIEFNAGNDLASCIEQALGHAAPVCQPDRSIANDGYQEFSEVVKFMLDQSARILKKDSAVCCCCCGGGGPSPVFADVARWMDERLIFDQAVVWDKGGDGLGGMSTGGLGWRYRRCYEFIMVGHRKGGKMSWYDQSARISNVIRVPRIIPKAYEHSTPKPVPLLETFLRLHTQEGDIVVDPFSGGGSTAEACIRLKRRFVGFEIDPKWVEYSNKRIEATIEELGRISAQDARPGQQVGMYTGPGLLPPSMTRTQTKIDFDSVPPSPAVPTPQSPAAEAASSSEPT